MYTSDNHYVRTQIEKWTDKWTDRYNALLFGDTEMNVRCLQIDRQIIDMIDRKIDRKMIDINKHIDVYGDDSCLPWWAFT